MNYKQMEEKEKKLKIARDAFILYKFKVSSLDELAFILGNGFSSSTLQRYLHELYAREEFTEDEYVELCNWLEVNKKNGCIKGGNVSQQEYGFSQDELGHFTGGKK